MTDSGLTVCNAAQTQALLPWKELMRAIVQAARDMQRGDIHAPARERPVQGGLHGGIVFNKKQLHARHVSTFSECLRYACFP